VNPVGLIWDLPDEAPPWKGQIFLWRSTVATQGAVSIPHYLESHSDKVRQTYLAFVHDLGKLRVGGISVREHLQDGAGNNFWWMGLLAEKSPFKTPEIYQALRLLALQDYLSNTPLSSLVLRGRDPMLAEALRLMCAQTQIAFSFEPSNAESERQSQRLAFWARMPGWLQAPLLALGPRVRRLPLRQMRPLPWNSGDNAVLICSFFAHLDRSAAIAGQFHSRQWGPLPSMMTTNGLRLNWLQNFWPDESAPHARSGVKLARRFNIEEAGRSLHGFVESYMGLRVLMLALRSWLFLCSRAWRLRGMPEHLHANLMLTFLWPVLQPAWSSSLTGRVGMANCINAHLFDAALGDIPKQKRGLYLFENQAWEKAFLAAWRRHGHGHITGVAHATVPYWHLYYAEDPRSLQGPPQECMPLPDLVAVNGEAARTALLTQGYSSNKLVTVEALRYLGLVRVGSGQTGDKEYGSHEIRVLIVGDMALDSLRDLLLTTRRAKELLPQYYSFAFKPHPAYVVDPLQFASLDVPVVTGNLFDLLRGFDCVIAGNSTSASVDAFLAGKPVIIGSSGQYLNLSPLRGQPGVAYFESPAQLVESLLAVRQHREPVTGLGKYFYLDENLPRWRRLLNLSQDVGKTGVINMDGMDENAFKHGI
jgi:surface carbohydrate biosynthesis protein (TIGR04326 family)